MDETSPVTAWFHAALFQGRSGAEAFLSWETDWEHEAFGITTLRSLAMNLNQVTLPARDVATAADFYRRLGLRLIVDALPRYVRFECPDGESTLSVERVTELGSGPGPVVYLECADLDDTVKRLASDGIRFDSSPTDQPWLWREARLRDPAGNALCLFRAGKNRRDPPWRVK
jgi:catechol 2,3-dioxygenase-like lactoylglutathione lyase family enzyme